MYNHADEGVQFAATEVFSLLRRHCSVSNGAGVQWERYIHIYSEASASNSFDADNEIIFRGPHGSTLLEISQCYEDSSFSAADRHSDPTWIWDGYTSATAVFDCPTCPYEDDIYEDAIVIQEGLSIIRIVNVKTSDNYTYTDIRDGSTKFVNYIDKDGEEAKIEAKIISGSETSLGEADKETRYVVEGSTQFTDADLTLDGDTNIILADDASLVGIETIASSNGSNLHIYGQSEQEGAMKADAVEGCKCILYGGGLYVGEINANFMLWNGEVRADKVNTDVLVVTGGTMSVSESITVSESVGVSGGSLDAESIISKELIVVKGSLEVLEINVSERTFFIGGKTSVKNIAYVASVILGEVSITEPETVINTPSGVSFEGTTLSLKSETTLSLKLQEQRRFGILLRRLYGRESDVRQVSDRANQRYHSQAVEQQSDLDRNGRRGKRQRHLQPDELLLQCIERRYG